MLALSCCQWPQRWLRTSCKRRESDHQISKAIRASYKCGSLHEASGNFWKVDSFIVQPPSACVSMPIVSIRPSSLHQRWHYSLQVKRNKGDIFGFTNAIVSLFTYYRVWDASSPRSVAKTGRRWRNFAADRRLDPWPRSNTTNSCWSWFYSPSTNAPPSRSPPRDTHPRAIYAMLRAGATTAAFKKDANQGQLISAVRVEKRQPGTKKKKKTHNLSAHESRGRSLIGRDGGCSRKICGNAPTYRSADSVLHKIFRGRRGCGLNREKPDRKGRRKKCRAEHGQGNVVNNSVINSHSCPQSH